MFSKQISAADFLKEFNLNTPSDKLKDQLEDLLNMDMVYKSAIKEISTKLEILDHEFQSRHKRNPIHFIQSRVKSPDSILNKLYRKGFEVSLASAKENLFDIAGIRVICSYIDDIYTIANLLKTQDDILLIREIDYIKDPKPNGYRSLHLVLKVPVFFSSHKEYIMVEVQIRTIAMDFWASLEHQLHYKSRNGIPYPLALELKECADTISSTDLKMQSIHSAVDMLYSANADNEK